MVPVRTVPQKKDPPVLGSPRGGRGPGKCRSGLRPAERLAGSHCLHERPGDRDAARALRPRGHRRTDHGVPRAWRPVRGLVASAQAAPPVINDVESSVPQRPAGCPLNAQFRAVYKRDHGAARYDNYPMAYRYGLRPAPAKDISVLGSRDYARLGRKLACLDATHTGDTRRAFRSHLGERVWQLPGGCPVHHRGAPGTLGTNPQTAGQLARPMLLLGLKHAASWHGLFFFVHGRLFSSLASLVQPRILLP